MPPALQVVGARVTLGGHAALAGVDLEVEGGATVAVLGPSGSGKSTLLRAIAGLQRLDAGDRDARRPLARRGARAPARRRADVPGRRALPPPRRGGERGVRPPDAGRRARARPRTRVEELLALVGLAGRERRAIASLSGGERSGSRWRARWRPARGCCCSTSRSGRSTARCTTASLPSSRELFARIGQTARLRHARRRRGVRARGPGGGDARGSDRPGRDAGASSGRAGGRVGGAVRRARERRGAGADAAA